MSNLKKAVPLLAIIAGGLFGILNSAFTSAHAGKKWDTMYTFEYNSSVSPTVANVQNNSNWAYNPDADECDNTQRQACTIQVTEASVDNPTTSPTLKSSFSIGATLYVPAGTAYVSSISDNDGDIVNRSND